LDKDQQDFIAKGPNNYTTFQDFLKASITCPRFENSLFKTQEKKLSFLKKFTQEKEKNANSDFTSIYSKRMKKKISNQETNKSISYYSINLHSIKGEERNLLVSQMLVEKIFKPDS
jgi:signal-transduction protein with cAMP-binding, CBS, and nucleotidyltransferase domain